MFEHDIEVPHLTERAGKFAQFGAQVFEFGIDERGPEDRESGTQPPDRDTALMHVFRIASDTYRRRGTPQILQAGEGDLREGVRDAHLLRQSRCIGPVLVRKLAFGHHGVMLHAANFSPAGSECNAA